MVMSNSLYIDIKIILLLMFMLYISYIVYNQLGSKLIFVSFKLCIHKK